MIDPSGGHREMSGVAVPGWFEAGHVNLKEEFAQWRGVRRCRMATALAQLDLVLVAQQVLPHVARNALDRMVDIADASGIYDLTAEPKRTR